MIVNSLPLIVVLRTDAAALGSNRLGRFVNLETLEELLFAFGGSNIAQAAVSQHGGVMHLQILRIDGGNLLQRFDGLLVVSLEKLETRYLIPHDAIARVFGIHNREVLQRGVVVA